MWSCLMANIQENLTQFPHTNPTMEKEFVHGKQRGKGLSVALGSFVSLMQGVRGKGQWGQRVA